MVGVCGIEALEELFLGNVIRWDITRAYLKSYYF